MPIPILILIGACVLAVLASIVMSWASNRSALWNMAFVVAATRRPQEIIAAARSVLKDMDAELPLYNARSMTEIVSATMATTRMVLSTLAVFAGVAAVLAGVGLYAVIAYIVRQRRKELAIRMALGATARSVGVGVLRDGLVLVACGVAAGCVVSVATAGLLSDLVVGVPARDPVTALPGQPLTVHVWRATKRAAQLSPAAQKSAAE